MATQKRVLTRADMLDNAQRPMEQVELPELGGVVWVQGLTGSERDRYEQSVMKMRGGQLIPNLTNARAKLIAVSLVDENGKVLFAEDELEEIGRLPARTTQRVWNKACELSGLSDTDVDELEGNLGAALDGGSSSGSPAISDGQSKNSEKASRVAS